MAKEHQAGAIKEGIELFLKEVMSEPDLRRLSELYKSLESNPNLNDVREYLYRFVIDMKARLSEAEIAGMFEDYIDQMRPLIQPLEKYVLNISFQKNLAVKFWEYLLDNSRIGDFFVLFDYAFLFEIIRIEKALQIGEKTPRVETLHRNMMEMIGSDKENSRRICSAMKENSRRICSAMADHRINYPTPDFSETTLFVKTISSVNDEIIGLLLKLPYLELTRGEGNLYPFLN